MATQGNGLPADYDVIALAEYANGASDQEVAKELRISMSKFKRLYSSDESFRAVIDDGRGHALAWWMKEGRVNLRNKQFSYVGWFQNMKNRYGWADKAEVSDTITKPIEAMSTEDLQKDIEAMLANLSGPTGSVRA